MNEHWQKYIDKREQYFAKSREGKLAELREMLNEDEDKHFYTPELFEIHLDGAYKATELEWQMYLAALQDKPEEMPRELFEKCFVNRVNIHLVVRGLELTSEQKRKISESTARLQKYSNAMLFFRVRTVFLNLRESHPCLYKAVDNTLFELAKEFLDHKICSEVEKCDYCLFETVENYTRYLDEKLFNDEYDLACKTRTVEAIAARREIAAFIHGWVQNFTMVARYFYRLMDRVVEIVGNECTKKGCISCKMGSENFYMTMSNEGGQQQNARFN